MIAYIKLLDSQEKYCGMMYFRPVVVLRMAPLRSSNWQYLHCRLVHVLCGLGEVLGVHWGVGLYLSFEEVRISLRLFGRE